MSDAGPEGGGALTPIIYQIFLSKVYLKKEILVEGGGHLWDAPPPGSATAYSLRFRQLCTASTAMNIPLLHHKQTNKISRSEEFHFGGSSGEKCHISCSSL